MKLSRQQTLELIRTRLRESVYGSGDLGYKWSWGQWRGHDIQDLPTEYLYWHVCNNDRLSRFHLEWLENHFGVCDWSWPVWQPPVTGSDDTEGHYSDSKGINHGHYSGQEPRSQPCSEELYWFRLRQAQRQLPPGRKIELP